MKRLLAAILVVACTGTPAAAAGESSRLSTPAPVTFETVRGREGFWRVGKDRSGVWWFVRPDGRADFLNSVTTVQPHLPGRDPRGPHYAARDWAGRSTSGPAMDRWAEATLARVRRIGFKGVGAWSDPVLHKYDVPITRDLNISTWLPHDARRVFSPKWETAVQEAVARQVTPLRHNRSLVGYYLDNELDWGDAAVGPSHYFDGLPLRDPNRREVLAEIRSLWPDLREFNRDWGTTARSWDELAIWTTLPHTPESSASGA